MIKHIVMWNVIDEATIEQLKDIKNEALKLNGEIKGMMELDFIINPLSSSTRRLMLVALYEDLEALESYQIHPLHKELSAKMKPIVKDRVCFDYIE